MVNVFSPDYDSFVSEQRELVNALSERLTEEKGFYIKSNVAWANTSQRRMFDVVVSRYTIENIIAIFEIKLKSSNVPYASNTLTDYVFKNTTASLFVIYDAEKKSYKYHQKNKENFIKTKSFDLIDIINAIEDISKAEKHELKENDNLKFFRNTEKILDPEWCREQLGVITCMNEHSETIECQEICRYSSLDSLFSSLKYKTIRMNGLPGMNDRNEGLFAWDMIYKLDNTDNEENKKRRREINNAFIVSYSSSNLKDNLTQWRLYGDDAKGVCCVYSILEEKLNDRFFLHNVRYIKESEKNEGISDDLLNLFLEYSKEHSDLSYYDLSPAIFFYKPNAYKSEDEIRLLFDNKKTSAYKTPQYDKQWVLTNANNIPNPYIDIPIDSIPLKLKEIILGPNMNDVDTIQAQLETLLEQQGIDADVILSNIDSYRNPTR